jgi:N-acetylglucosamine-6-phosphate deacetylase
MFAYQGAHIFDGQDWHENASLVVDGSRIVAIGAVPPDASTVALPKGYIVPGFVDLQVNGGGGHLIGPATQLADLEVVLNTHARFGVTGLLPTLITDTDAVMDRILATGAEAARHNLKGFLGLHLEGPHLSIARKGAHDPRHIRPMIEADLVRLERAKQLLPSLLVTVAAETVAPEQIVRLVKAGIVVSLGHSDASFETASSAIRAGATMATHLFNAMGQIGNRDPGVVGAALHHGTVSAGIIADGIHVHPATFGIALRAKRTPGHLFLVSDSMSQAGTNLTRFELGGRTIYRRDGALRLDDDTLAGADLTMDQAIRYAHQHLELELDEAIRMASTYPSNALGRSPGQLLPGNDADFVLLTPDLGVKETWRKGIPSRSDNHQRERLVTRNSPRRGSL